VDWDILHRRQNMPMSTYQGFMRARLTGMSRDMFLVGKEGSSRGRLVVY
jgi:hypothetical protein